MLKKSRRASDVVCVAAPRCYVSLMIRRDKRLLFVTGIVVSVITCAAHCRSCSAVPLQLYPAAAAVGGLSSLDPGTGDGVKLLYACAVQSLSFRSTR